MYAHPMAGVGRAAVGQGTVYGEEWLFERYCYVGVSAREIATCASVVVGGEGEEGRGEMAHCLQHKRSTGSNLSTKCGC